MSAHRSFGFIRISRNERVEDLAVLTQGLLRAARTHSRGNPGCSLRALHRRNGRFDGCIALGLACRHRAADPSGCRKFLSDRVV